MRPYVDSIEIDAPVDKVWRVLEDVPAWDEWIPKVVRVQGVADVAQPGAAFDVSTATAQPRLRGVLDASAVTRLPKEQITFTEVESPRRMAFVRKVPGMETTTIYVLEQLPNDKTKITCIIGASGTVERFLGWLPGFKPSEPQPKNLLSNLKSYVERAE